ncbi:hypothetical protein [Falsiroseomonas sp.]|uniref:hypothetical protein n=1 Tax=Falsiroseomonas sp. TaxID=2870721 RepID=UPI003565657D
MPLLQDAHHLSPEQRAIESQIEFLLLHAMSAGLGTDVPAKLLLVRSWTEAEAIMRNPPPALARETVFVFPQTPIGNYRVDFLVGVAAPHWLQPEGERRFSKFIVEADGRKFHGLHPVESDPRDVRRDVDRDALIRRETGLDVLRFSGPELVYHLDRVQDVLTAYVRSRISKAADTPAAVRIRGIVAGLTGHPALREQFTFGSTGATFSALYTAVAALDAEELEIRQAEPAFDDDLLGGPIHVSVALERALRNIAANIERSAARVG